MYIVAKMIRDLFIFDLHINTWIKSSTVSGAFSGQPDHVKFITGGLVDGLLYFTEEASRSGVHARNEDGEYVAILEASGDQYKGMEVAGLAFSPDKKHMYFTFQYIGHLYDVTRADGYPFDGVSLDIKYHNHNP
jgi:hypothetical protein